MARNGFSLVELMVALFVMALLAGAAVLAMPGDSSALRHEADRFAVRASAARDEAITAGAPVALVVAPSGYGFERRSDGGWTPLADSRFASTAWSAGTRAQVSGGSGGRVLFDEMGLAAGDVAVRLARGRVAATVHVGRDGKVSVDAPR